MANQINICNRALAEIGTRSMIASLDEESPEARNCKLIFDSTRDELLQMAHWNFAKRTQYLSLIKSAPGTPTNPASTASQWGPQFPAPPWLYEYAYPTECVSMRSVVQQVQNAYVGSPIMTGGTNVYPYAIGPGAKFEVSTDLDPNGNFQNVVLTNQYQAIGIYTVRIVNPNLFDAQFVEAFVQAMAAKLVIPLSGEVNLANLKFQQANAIIIAARASNANEGLTIIDNMPDWITIREDYPRDVFVSGYVAPYGPLYGVV